MGLKFADSKTSNFIEIEKLKGFFCTLIRGQNKRNLCCGLKLFGGSVGCSEPTKIFR